VSPPCHSEQAVPLAGLLRVVLHGLGEVLVEGHGLPPGNDCPPTIVAGFGSHIAEQESSPEIHPQQDGTNHQASA
jgi:hypothetical protein